MFSLYLCGFPPCAPASSQCVAVNARILGLCIGKNLAIWCVDYGTRDYELICCDILPYCKYIEYITQYITKILKCINTTSLAECQLDPCSHTKDKQIYRYWIDKGMCEILAPPWRWSECWPSGCADNSMNFISSSEQQQEKRLASWAEAVHWMSQHAESWQGHKIGSVTWFIICVSQPQACVNENVSHTARQQWAFDKADCALFP